jgi:GTP-binding protein HflX
VVKTRTLHRAARAKVPYPVVALVGYTNAGKSTLFNRLTGAEVMAKDMLFATLDPTMRAVSCPRGTEVILSDTVGFISDLPTQLVAAFRATLEEVLEADLILHVRDISHPETEEQAEDVARILEDLGVAETVPQLEVWNKIDLRAASWRPRRTSASRRALPCAGPTGRRRRFARSATAWPEAAIHHDKTRRQQRKTRKRIGPEPFSQHQRPQHDGDGRNQQRDDHRVA